MPETIEIIITVLILCFIFFILPNILNYFRTLYKNYKRKQWDLVLRTWLDEIEPKNRNFKGYPLDWGFRKYVVRKRYNNKCSECQIEMKRGFHVHHKIPIAKGGNHSLDNLELLCESCHIKKHPGLGLFRKKTT